MGALKYALVGVVVAVVVAAALFLLLPPCSYYYRHSTICPCSTWVHLTDMKLSYRTVKR